MLARGLDFFEVARRNAALLFFFTALLALPVTAYAVTGRPSTATDDYRPEPARPAVPTLQVPSRWLVEGPPKTLLSAQPREQPPRCDIENAMDLWRTCDPIPRSADAWDDALVSGRAGMLEISANPEMRLRIDGRNYDLRVGGGPRVTRLPIAPGQHTLDFISDAYVYGTRRQVTIQAGQTERLVLELRGDLPAPVAPGGSWYQGSTGGRPRFQNYSDELTGASGTVTSFRPAALDTVRRFELHDAGVAQRHVRVPIGE